MLITIATSWINYVGVRTGARVNNVTAAIKIVALVGLAFIGPLLGGGSLGHLRAAAARSGGVPVGRFGLALSPVLFSYLGWNASVYVASEIHDPGRNVPRSLFAGLGVCTAIYLVVNLAYLYALPVDALRGNHARRRGGGAACSSAPPAARIGAALILASIVSCLNATILVGPRIAYAMALDGLFFAGVDRVHAAYQTPHVAIIAQALTAIALIVVLQSFPERARLHDLRHRPGDHGRHHRALRAAPPAAGSAAALPRLGLSAGAGAVPGRQRRRSRWRCCAAARSSAPSPWPSTATGLPFYCLVRAAPTSGVCDLRW